MDLQTQSVLPCGGKFVVLACIAAAGIVGSHE